MDVALDSSLAIREQEVSYALIWASALCALYYLFRSLRLSLLQLLSLSGLSLSGRIGIKFFYIVISVVLACTI